MSKVTVTITLDESVKASGQARAKEQLRSFSGHIEYLLTKDVETKKAAN